MAWAGPCGVWGHRGGLSCSSGGLGGGGIEEGSAAAVGVRGWGFACERGVKEAVSVPAGSGGGGREVLCPLGRVPSMQR